MQYRSQNIDYNITLQYEWNVEMSKSNKPIKSNSGNNTLKVAEE